MLLFVSLFFACVLSVSTSIASPVQIDANEIYASESGRPNIVWVMGEDMGNELSCYGHPAVQTPNFDRLAKSGMRFTNAFGTAPSCTPARNAMITGVYQVRTDTQDQRRRGVVLPEGIVPITKLLQQNGYYTAIGCGFSGKTDLNFSEEGLFDGKDWKDREPGQPFFAQVTLYDSHRLTDGWQKVTDTEPNPVDRSAVEFPPYFPDHPVVREDWARYLESIQSIDRKFGRLMQRLDDEGIADDTVVIFIGDNGKCHLRGKCWLYDAGLQVPFLLKLPPKSAGRSANEAAGTVSDDLISTVDISATVLDLAGVELPDYLDGQSLVSENYRPRTEIFGARDLVDTVMDRIRCVRTKDFKYIRNYNPENGYRDCVYVQNNRPMLAVIRGLHIAGRLNATQKLFLQKVKPREELYDVNADPHEIQNLANDPEYADVLGSLRTRLDGWIEATGDAGLKEMRELSARQETAEGKRSADPRTYLAEVVAQLEKKWPENRTIRIVTHGHSVPTGYFRNGAVETFKSYPHLLHRKISEAYPTAVVNVIPTGIGGESSPEGVKRFTEDVLALKPDVVTIDYGLNDRRVGLKAARDALTEMISLAKAQGVKVILLTPTGDMAAKLNSASDLLVQHAEQIRQLAAEHEVGLVDSLQFFAWLEAKKGNYKDWMSQGNHPNLRGHTVVAEKLAVWFLP